MPIKAPIDNIFQLGVTRAPNGNGHAYNETTTNKTTTTTTTTGTNGTSTDSPNNHNSLATKTAAVNNLNKTAASKNDKTKLNGNANNDCCDGHLDDAAAAAKRNGGQHILGDDQNENSNDVDYFDCSTESSSIAYSEGGAIKTDLLY